MAEQVTDERTTRKRQYARLVWASKPRRAPNPRDLEFQTAELVIPNVQRDERQLGLLASAHATVDYPTLVVEIVPPASAVLAESRGRKIRTTAIGSYSKPPNVLMLRVADDGRNE